MIMDELKNRTVSDMFIVPILKISRTLLKSVGYKNSYMFNGEEEEVYDNVIHLLFQPMSVEKFNDFVFSLRLDRKDVVDEKDYPNGFIVVTFALPKKFKDDYEKLWQGRYSEMSEEYKKAIPSVVKIYKDGNAVTEMSAQHMIFSKYQPLRRKLEELFDVEMTDAQELWTKMTIERETFKLNNYAEPITTDAI